MNHGHTEHDGRELAEGPAGYNGGNAPTAAEKAMPVKHYPSSGNMGRTREHIAEGPGCENFHAE